MLDRVPSQEGRAFDAGARANDLAGTAERNAARAAGIAARHERLVVEGKARLRRLHGEMAAMQRRVEHLHRDVATIHRNEAARLADHATRAARDLGPDLLGTVAAELRARGTALTLLGVARHDESATASDPFAANAQDLEFTLGEGPAHDAVRIRKPVVFGEDVVPARWARYSPAVTELGVRSIAAAPMCLRTRCFGVLTVFDPPGGVTLGHVAGAARALIPTLLLGGGDGPLPAEDDLTVVHQATGMIATRLRCSTADALDALRARAFAENQTVGALARRVVDRQYVFE